MFSIVRVHCTRVCIYLDKVTSILHKQSDSNNFIGRLELKSTSTNNQNAFNTQFYLLVKIVYVLQFLTFIKKHLQPIISNLFFSISFLSTNVKSYSYLKTFQLFYNHSSWNLVTRYHFYILQVHSL